MFTWICPKCGTEVPPSYNDCPNCAAREKAALAPAPVAAPAPAPAAAPVYVPPQAQAPIPQAPVFQTPVAQAPVPPAPVAQATPATGFYRQPPLMGTPPEETPLPMAALSYGGAPLRTEQYTEPYLPPPSSGMPSWLIAVLSIVGVAALGYGVIHFMRGQNGVAAESAAVTETERPSGDTSPVAKFVEVVGFRIVENKQQVQLKFIIVNHSSGEIAPFELDLQVRAKNAKADDAPLFTVKTPVSGILPFEAKDMSIPVKTALRAYELPDWQFITATFQILQR